MLSRFTKKFAADVVVRFHENLSQPRLSNGVVLGVELVESMESVPVLEKNIGQI